MVRAAHVAGRGCPGVSTFFVSPPRRFRGHYSRLYYHSYYSRKEYLHSVEKASEALRETISKKSRAEMEQMAASRELAARRKLDRFSTKLHHLVSTRTQPGIYNSPMHGDDLPTAFGIPVEHHLREAVKPKVREELKRRPIARFLAKPDLSVASTTPYRTAEEIAREEDALNRSTFLAGNFRTLGRSGALFNPAMDSVHTGTPYIDGGVTQISREAKKSSWVSAKV